MYKDLSRKGFTLIEVVLAIAVGLIVIAGVSVGYHYAKKVAIIDNQKKDVGSSASTSTPLAAPNSTVSAPTSTPKKSPIAPPQATGTLQGQMIVGPICPVEQAGHPCEPTPETYAAHPVYVYRTDRKTLLVTLTPDAKGQFKVTLPSGDYWVDVDPANPGVGSVQGAPAAVHIIAGATTKIVIDIDIGMR